MKKSKKNSKDKSPYFKFALKDKQKMHGERIGQFVWNALAYSGYWKAPEANNLFFISDEELVYILNKYVKKYYGED